MSTMTYLGTVQAELEAKRAAAEEEAARMKAELEAGAVEVRHGAGVGSFFSWRVPGGSWETRRMG